MRRPHVRSSPLRPDPDPHHLWSDRPDRAGARCDRDVEGGAQMVPDAVPARGLVHAPRALQPLIALQKGSAARPHADRSGVRCPRPGSRSRVRDAGSRISASASAGPESSATRRSTPRKDEFGRSRRPERGEGRRAPPSTSLKKQVVARDPHPRAARLDGRRRRDCALSRADVGRCLGRTARSSTPARLRRWCYPPRHSSDSKDDALTSTNVKTFMLHYTSLPQHWEVKFLRIPCPAILPRRARERPLTPVCRRVYFPYTSLPCPRTRSNGSPSMATVSAGLCR